MTGVLLLNLGGPDSPESIKPFLKNLFSDRQIIRLGPWEFMQGPLASFISSMRAPKTTDAYGLIGGASPINKITTEQAEALEKRLSAHGDFKVYMGMKYWHPFIGEALDQAQQDGAGGIIALSLYPHYSAATTGSAEATLKEDMRKRPLRYQTVPPWYDHPKYIEALAGTVRDALENAAPGAEVVFSAHSLPVSLIAGGDPYFEHIMATAKAVAQQVPMRWHMGFQSRSGPVRWLEPSVQEVLGRLAAEGVEEVVMVPVSFVSDHIETLYEIDILFNDMAKKLGLRLLRAESLNTNPTFIQALEDLVLRSAEKLKW